MIIPESAMNTVVNDEGSIATYNSRFTIECSTETSPSVISYPKVEHNDPKVAEEEQKNVNRAKMLVFLVLLLAAVGAASSIFRLVRNGERHDFEVQFKNYAAQIIAVAQENSLSTFETIETFAVTVSSFAQEANETWPFVTVPDFAARAERLAELSGASTLALLPIIQNQEDSGNWYGYSQVNMLKHFKEDIDYMGLNTTADIMASKCSPVIFKLDVTTAPPSYSLEDRPFPWFPISQGYPIAANQTPLLNYNMANGERINHTIQTALALKGPTVNFVTVAQNFNPDFVNFESTQTNIEYVAESQIIQPIFERVTKNRKSEKKTVAVLVIIVNWISYFQKLLPEGANGVVVVLKSSCNDFLIGIDSITYEINGLDAKFIKEGDGHDPAYDDLVINAPFVNPDHDSDEIPNGTCAAKLSLSIYPSRTLENDFMTNNPIVYTIVVITIFVFTSIVFVIFDFAVRRRQDKVMARVIRQDKIVSNMFPTQFRDRLYGTDNDGKNKSGNSRETVGSDDIFGTVPLAELYLDVSVIFADISGFTAWASTREPSQVFQLLESIYQSFDNTAYRRGVFKVETVGDCYVACVGLPEPKDDHMVAAAKFSRDILHDMDGLTRKLEISMGPDTADLKLRIGIHSGQVTAGVLRGDRSRFQLFGDTVNTASRMESTSRQKHIQLSHSSAEELRKFGYSRWIRPRKDKITCKGKGDMQTYWLISKADGKEKKRKSSTKTIKTMTGITEQNEETDNSVSDAGDGGDYEFFENMTKTQRLVEWNVRILSPLLQQILAARDSSVKTKKGAHQSLKILESTIGKEGTVLEQFKEIIALPQVSAKDLRRRRDPDSVRLSDQAMSQLHDLLLSIAGLYRDNPFHNFEHASHVTASVRKLLSRIVKVDMVKDSVDGVEVQAEDLLGHSYGITSDPLTQFAVVFSAFIHDADHPGVPNSQLVKEKTKNAVYYKEKSVAEQNSVDLAWDILMQEKYADLRACIYSNDKELQQFRQLVVNVVMATDICDKELGMLRKSRWAVAFSDDEVDSTHEEAINRKATIVLEHLIQASDVSHTMQHWHVFRQWNENLFKEMYGAYKAGRGDTDPSINWYKSEIGFFDFYIIPLAKKLDSCGVFGVSSQEYLNYATGNREEWARRGKDIVKEYVENFNRGPKIE